MYAYAPYITEISWLEENYIFPQMQDGKLTVETPKPSSGSTILSLLPTLIMVVALGFLFYLMMNQGGNGKAFSFGKSKARLYKGEGKKITFAEVAGLDEEKRNLRKSLTFSRIRVNPTM